MKKEYTEDEMMRAIKDERLKHLAVLNYLLNMNSHTLPRGVDYEKAWDDIQDYEQYLAEMI
jgi:hypothetical protein